MSAATINFANFLKKPAKAKTVYPVIETERAKELAAVILTLSDEFDVIEANLLINKADLRSLVVPEFFKRHAGLSDVPSSMAINAADGREVLVSMTSRYKQPTDRDALNALLGEVNAERYMKPSFKLEIDSEKIPQAKQQAVFEALVATLTSFGCAEALSAKPSIAPVEDFHVARHTMFTPEVNMQIENIMPCTVAVKTKGRKT